MTLPGRWYYNEVSVRLSDDINIATLCHFRMLGPGIMKNTYHT